MKNKAGHEVWFQRRFFIGLTPVRGAGYVLLLGALAGFFGLSELGDRLGGDQGGLAALGAIAVLFVAFGLALRHSSSKADW